MTQATLVYVNNTRNVNNQVDAPCEYANAPCSVYKLQLPPDCEHVNAPCMYVNNTRHVNIYVNVPCEYTNAPYMVNKLNLLEM